MSHRGRLDLPYASITPEYLRLNPRCWSPELSQKVYQHYSEHVAGMPASGSPVYSSSSLIMVYSLVNEITSVKSHTLPQSHGIWIFDCDDQLVENPKGGLLGSCSRPPFPSDMSVQHCY